MSLNLLIDEKYLIEVQSLTNALREFFTQWQYSSTQEQRSLLESQALSLFERLNDLDIQFQQVSAGDFQQYEELDAAYTEQRLFIELTLNKLRGLVNAFINKVNSREITLLQLAGKKKRVYQKLASSRLWSTDEAKFVFGEKFLTWSGLDTSLVNGEALDVNTDQGVATLPVQDIVTVSAKNAYLGAGSNGRPGNSDVQVTTNNIALLNVFGDSSTKWFEYEKLDQGPVDLTLVVEFSQPEVVNRIQIDPVGFGSNIAFTVEDIKFGSSSIKELVPPVAKDFWSVKSVNNGLGWSVTFLPVVTQSVVLRLRQNLSYKVRVAERNGIQLRDRFAIGIKRLQFSKVLYSQTGQLNSKSLSLPHGLYAATALVEHVPALELFELDVEGTVDNGGTWTSAYDNGPETYLLDGSTVDFRWRLGLSRVPGALDSLSSWTGEQKHVYKTQEQSAFRGQDVQFQLNDVVAGSPLVLETGLLRRGQPKDQKLLAGGKGNFLLPLVLLDYDLEPSDMRVFVDRREYTYVNDNSSVSAGEWSFSDDYRELVFNDSDLETSQVSKISTVLSPESMVFVPSPGGFTHYFKLPADPDKQTMVIKYLPDQSSSNTIVLPRDRKIVKLPHSRLLSNGTKIVTASGTALTEVASRVLLGAGKYFIDYEHGVLHLFENLGDDRARITYSHVNAVTLDDGGYDVVYSGSKPVGVFIPERNFIVRTVEEDISATPQSKIGFDASVISVRPQVFSTVGNSFQCSYDKLVPGRFQAPADLFVNNAKPVEVKYVDGASEFFGLQSIENEATVETVSTAGFVEFRLSAGGLWHEDTGVIFSNTSVFASKQTALGLVNSVGEYYISPQGDVTVFVGVGQSLPGGITINYMYRDPDFNPRNKFSVDYEHGMLYAYSDIREGATVSYGVALYEIEYDIGLPVENTYNRQRKSVQAKTTKLFNDFAKTKVVYAVPDVEFNIGSLEPYFSPLVSLIGFRCQ